MRKSAVGALTGAVAAVGLLLSGTPGLVAYGAAASSTPTTTPIASSGTVLIAPLAVSGGGGDPTATIRAALNAPFLKNIKLTIKTAPQPFKSIDEALAAVKTSDVVAVIWMEAAVDSTTAPILYFTLPRRQYFESFQPALRENTTGNGIVTLPDDLQLPYDAKLDAKTLTAYTQAQLFTAFADYTDAQTALQTAQTTLSANTALTDSAALAAEINFEQAFLNGTQRKVSSLDASLSGFTDLSTDSTVRSELQAYAYANLGALYIDQGDDTAANDAITSALAIDNNLIPALLDQGSLAFLSNDLTAANDSYNAVLALDPNNIYALNNRGWINYQQNQSDAALADFGEAIKVDPNFIDAYLNRVSVYRAQGNLTSALSDADVAVALDPNYEYAYSLRGNLNVRAQHYLAALDDLNKAISLSPNQSTNYENRGYVYEALGDLDKAFTDYTRAISFAPTDSYSYLYRGNIYLQRGDYYNAVVDEALSIQFNKNNASQLTVAYFYRAQAYRGLQRWSEAIADYQKYVNVTQAQGYWVGAARAYIKTIQGLLTPTPTPTNVPTETNTPTNTPLPPTATATLTLTPILTASSTITLTPTLMPNSTATLTPTTAPTVTSTTVLTQENTVAATIAVTVAATANPGSTQLPGTP